MLVDYQYLKTSFQPSELEHHYGQNVHILKDTYLFTLLGQFCQPECKQPIANQLLTVLYRDFVKYVINAEFPVVEKTIKTRMGSIHPEGEFKATVIDPHTRVVTVGLARAGIVPSQICFDTCNQILDPNGVRQDHISINRKVDANEKVVGTDLGGVKIGGDINEAFVLFPDPMGATGSTLRSAVEIYRKEVPGTAKKFIALHLITTPEYLFSAKNCLPDLTVYALRLDRGLSAEEALATAPGTHWQKERGLNSKQYIVPGAGGVGEILNNSFV